MKLHRRYEQRRNVTPTQSGSYGLGERATFSIDSVSIREPKADRERTL
jgi:hypothetical protein